MKTSKLKETALRVVILLAGLMIAHLGITLFLLAELGSDPFDVLIQGIFRSLDRALSVSFLTHGRVHLFISLLIILILLFADRSYIKIGTVICMAFGGPIIDMFTVLLNPIFEGGLSLALRIVLNAIGCCILAFGMTIVIKSEAGTGPNDLVAVVISDKLKKRFSVIRVLVDFGFALIGWLLGGTVGIGTVICAFLVGPIAGVFLPFNEKWIQKTVSRLVG